jgi:hypothetical protein
VKWTAAANSTFGTDYIYAIAYGGGKFVAGGQNGKMAYSTDGTSLSPLVVKAKCGIQRGFRQRKKCVVQKVKPSEPNLHGIKRNFRIC